MQKYKVLNGQKNANMFVSRSVKTIHTGEDNLDNTSDHEVSYSTNDNFSRELGVSSTAPWRSGPRVSRGQNGQRSTAHQREDRV